MMKYMDDKASFNFKAVLGSAIIATVLTVIGSFIISSFSNKQAWLQYEILPVSQFKKDSVQLYLVSIKIFNDGTKECEDVTINIRLGTKINAKDYSIQKSSPSMPINQHFDSISKRISYTMPYLNPGEQIVLSFSFNENVNENNIQVDVRGRGSNGKKLDLVGSAVSNMVIFGLLAMVVITIYLMSLFLFHQGKIIKDLRFQLNRLKKELEEKSK